MMIRATVYDLDNTLTGSFDYVFRLLNEVMLFFNISLPAEQIRNTQARNLTFEEMFAVLFPNPTEYTGETPFWQVVLTEYRERSKNIPFVSTKDGPTILAQLMNRGLVQGIVTNRLLRTEERLQQAGYDIKTFSFILAPATPETRKPSPRAFDEALALLHERGISREETVCVGDHLDDFFAAHAAGLTFFAVLTGLTTKEDFLQAGLAEMNILQDLGELPQKLN